MYKDERLEPVELTPEIIQRLEICNLEGVNAFYYLVAKQYADGEPYYCCELFTDTQTIQTPIHIHFLHQWQNLHFALTGEELKVTL